MASPPSSQVVSDSEQVIKRLSEPLPTDSDVLTDLVNQSRQHLTITTAQVKSLDSQLNSIQASYTDLLNKSSKWEDELGHLKAKIPILEREIKSERSKREEEENRVKDLRMTSEESRRAIMRLQGEQNENRMKAAKEKEKEKANHRRSLGPGAMAGWNVAGGVSPSLLNNATSEEDKAEARELKKSKRASLAFGPNAGFAGGTPSGLINSRNSLIGNPPHSGVGGHGRSASVSNGKARRSMSYANDSGSDSEQVNSRSGVTGGGLRGLRLSGAPQSTASSNKDGETAISHEASSSRRSSMASTSSAISPRSNASDLPTDQNDQIALTEAALTRSTSLSTRMRGASNGSSIPRRNQSSGEHPDGLPSGGLAVPGSNSTLGILSGGSNSRLSASPTPSQSAMSSMGSPIMEESPSHEQFANMSSSEIDSAVDDEALNTATISNFNLISPSGTNTNSNYSTLRSQAILKAKESEIERLKLEMKGLRKTLEESNESRLASETCLKILREFISNHDNGDGESKAVLGQVEEKLDHENSAGIQLLKGMKLPPLPTDKELDNDVGAKKSDLNGTSVIGAGAGWSIKLPTFGKRGEEEGQNASANENSTTSSNVNQTPANSASTIDKRTSLSTPLVSSLGSLWNRSTSASQSKDHNQNGASVSPTKARSRDSISASSDTSNANISQSLESNTNASGNAFGRNLGSWFATKKTGSAAPSHEESSISTSPTRSTANQNSSSIASPTSQSHPGLSPAPSLPARKPSLHSQSSTSNYSEYSNYSNDDDKDKGLGIAMSPGIGKGKEIQLNERARKAMSRTVSVEEHGDFLAPTFD